MIDHADQRWLPLFSPMSPGTGILPAQAIRAAWETGTIRATHPLAPGQIQPASLDLRLGPVAYEVPASFLAGPRSTVCDKVQLLATRKIDLAQPAGAVLERERVYVAPLMESLHLRRRLSAVANPKSSTGRLDVFARVITDYGQAFDSIPVGYKGPLWLEIAPRSFRVVVREGSRLAQIRLKRGNPVAGEAFVRRLNKEHGLSRTGEGAGAVYEDGIAVSVDIQGDPACDVIGYKARKVDQPVDMDLSDHYDPADFWENVHRPKAGGIILKPDDFHILVSKELFSVPAHLAADMVAYDTLVGEFRVHYAGFFDPGFGSGTGIVGTPAVLEVRSHEVPFLVEHGQLVGRLIFERLTEPTEAPYGGAIGSSYQRQGLTLGKHFRRSYGRTAAAAAVG